MKPFLKILILQLITQFNCSDKTLNFIQAFAKKQFYIRVKVFLWVSKDFDVIGK